MFMFSDEIMLTASRAWQGVIAHENVWTIDNRIIMAGAFDLSARVTHLPIFTLGFIDHPHQHIGVIDEVWREGHDILASGIVVLPPGRHPVGVDVDQRDAFVTMDSGDIADDVNLDSLTRITILSCQLRGFHIVSLPAWPDTYIEVA